MAEDRVSASSSSSSLFTLNRPKGLQGAEGRRERAGKAARLAARPLCQLLRWRCLASRLRSPEAVQQVQHHGHHVHRQPHQQPQRALEGLHERVQRAPGDLLRVDRPSASPWPSQDPTHPAGPMPTFLTRMVRPWYLKGLENSMYCARSLLMVSGATIMSACPLSSSPIIPFHSFLLLLFTCGVIQPVRTRTLSGHSATGSSPSAPQASPSPDPTLTLQATPTPGSAQHQAPPTQKPCP